MRNRAAYHTVLLLVAGADRLARELPCFPDGDECGSQSQRNDRPEQKTSSIEANDDIDLLGWRIVQGMGSNVMHEMGDQGLEDERIPEDGEDVKKDDSLTYFVRSRVELAFPVGDKPSWESRGGQSNGS